MDPPNQIDSQAYGKDQCDRKKHQRSAGHPRHLQPWCTPQQATFRSVRENSSLTVGKAFTFSFAPVWVFIILGMIGTELVWVHRRGKVRDLPAGESKPHRGWNRMKGLHLKVNCRRAAAGMMGCLLIGSSLGVPIQQHQAVALGNEVEPPEVGVKQEAATQTVNDEASYDTKTGRLALDPSARYKITVKEHNRPRLVFTYTVKPGDSLWSIGSALNTDIGTLLALNPDIDPHRLQVGQKLQAVKDRTGIPYVTPQGSSVEGHFYTDDAPVPGEIVFLNPRSRPAPRNMLVSRSGSVRRAASPPSPSHPDQRPAESVPSHTPDNAAHAHRETSPVAWIWPITGGSHTSEFGPRWGRFHAGIDIAVPTGTEALASRSGTVVFAGWDHGYGYCVLIDHGDGFQTRYAHASALLVQTGEAVEQGQPVILVGSTGNSTGSHLHFEVIQDGVPKNPRAFLP